jgi:hypothetical protein
LLLCAATAKSAILLRADGWLELDEKKRAKLKPEDVAAALMAAVESPMSAAVTERIAAGPGRGGTADRQRQAHRTGERIANSRLAAATGGGWTLPPRF